MSFDPYKPLGKTVEVSRKDSLQITQMFKRALQTPEGEAVLKFLESKTINRPVEPFEVPTSQDDMLRYWMHRRFREGQNNIVKQIIDEVNKIVKEEDNG